MRVCARTSPSLALLKYWGKREGGVNLPASPSLALTLGGLETTTLVGPAQGESDIVVVDGIERDSARYEGFFAEVRKRLRSHLHFHAESRNSFPGGSGFASSSSGFAALALAAARLVHELEERTEASLDVLSEIARVGSASASRAVFGGFTVLPAGAPRAEAFLPAEHWPELRVVAAVVARGEKPISSRAAMEATRETSPYYNEWIIDAPRLVSKAKDALESRDLPRLGALARLSYSRMHASALAADPPILYWLPESLALIRACASLRAAGIGAWETMDAGPQVKVLCLATDLDAVLAGLSAAAGNLEYLIARPGPAPEVFTHGEGLAFPSHRLPPA